MKKTVPDSTLSTLWSKAVLAKYRYDPITGREGTEAHHVIPKGRQSRFAIRWNIRNGAALEHSTHDKVTTGDMDITEKVIEYVRERGDFEYLQRIKYMLKDEFLKDLGLTENEYRIKVRNELKKIIEEQDYGL